MFQDLDELKPDALVEISKRFRADNRPGKLDLGVGVYRDSDGSSQILGVVKRAELLLLNSQTTKSYLPAGGDTDFIKLMTSMILGSESIAVADGRVAAVQCPGGTGAFHQALALVKQCSKNPTVWVGEPTWPNHLPMLKYHNFAVKTYKYYDVAKKSLQFDQMLSALQSAKAGDLILLHGVCHNPTGADLSYDQWKQVVLLAKNKALIPLIDFAYQGFGQGNDEDARGVRLLAEVLPEALIAASCSKSFGLYRERIGILVSVSGNRETANIISATLHSLARLNYSNPPDHGGGIVRTILADPTLRSQWAGELSDMRQRVRDLRQALAEQGRKQSFDLDFIDNQSGLFATFDLHPTQVQVLAKKHAIHMSETGRINISGLTMNEIERFVCAVRSVTNG